ncbi:MAG: acyl-CoA dehydrogenase family protein [Deltaproteobacteria bacterium]|nr:acyl-CoA dehydrogenase family protein [Deltaproteobacteria bacterium]MBW2399541.1 acyl-CoA dehydrogenase family protein [Deltaproteobacteria bacterium]
MSSDLFNTSEHEVFRDTVRKFAEEELAPRAREFDEMGRIDKSLFKRMGDLGLLGLRYDPEWGGSGLDWSFSTVLFEELGRCDNAGVTMGISVQTDMATPSLHQFGSDDLKAQYLAPAIAGEMVAAIAVTEPDAGSDVAGIKTRAVRDGDDWVINGSKIYITNAATADWLCLLAVTDPDAGYGGFTQIVVPTDAPGFRYDLLDKIGNWGSDTGQLFFEDLRVPIANTIGDIGRGFQQQMMQFQDERLVACVSTVAGSKRLWERTKEYCEQRVLFGKPLSKMQVTQFKFVEMLTQLTAARELTYACVRKRVAGEDATQEISMAKIFCGRTSRMVADECIQLHGGYGYMKDCVAGRAFVDSRLVSIGGGADETMIHYLAKMLGF